MALSDTAELVIALNLRGNAERGLRGINSAIDNISRNATVRGGLGQISQGIGVGLRNSALIGGVALAGLVTQVKAGVESLRELENVEAQTRAALESTGGVSGQTAASIRALSEEYETLGGVLDDKIIQAGANVLLTFRRIDEDAFEPALEAALNLSTALGTDLQSAILQVGKALEDPVAGVTALRRAGVQFTEAQQDQIKALVEANDLYGAQQVVLEELSVQVGGRFAAAGTTNAATVARMGDAWEDLQQTLTRATLPAIDKVSRRLTEIFADPAVIASVSEFGDRLAGFLNEENLDRAEDAIRGTFGYLATIPWGTIGDGLRIAGQAAGVAINAFKSLPPGVQNALITLLAANKLTGGLVATGLGQLAAVALGSLRTITAGHVTVIGPVTGGPGGVGGVGAGRGGLLAGAAATAGGAAVATGGILAIEDIRSGTREGIIQGILSQGPAGLIGRALGDPIQELIGSLLPPAEAVRAEIVTTRDALAANIVRGTDATSRTIDRVNATMNLERSAANAYRAADASRIQSLRDSHSAATFKLDSINSQLAGANFKLAAIQAKNFSPTIKLENKISSTVITNNITQTRLLSSGTGMYENRF